MSASCVEHSNEDDDDDNNNNNDNDDDATLLVRVTLTLAPECADRTLQVPIQEAIAVPADTGRKGLSAVINHLLDRKQPLGGADEGDDEEEGEGADDGRLSAIPFEFMITGSSSNSKSNNRLLRTAGIEREARRLGLTLERAVPITYFPAQRAPEIVPSGHEAEPLPDWIAALSCVTAASNSNNNNSNTLLCTGCYDGSILVFDVKTDSLETLATKSLAHCGPIQCLSTAFAPADNCVWIATGSMDHTLQLHHLDTDTFKMNLFANCAGGHASAISSVDLITSSHSNSTSHNNTLLASGDWDGGVCIWDCGRQQLQPAAASSAADREEEEEETPAVKKARMTGSHGAVTAATTTTRDQPVLRMEPKISIRAHSSKVSGVSWGNCDKRSNHTNTAATQLLLPRQLITGSWDHSIKVWDVERQDCLLALNGSRVVTCLDTSYHLSGVVATGHPDCTVRLWDTRAADDCSKGSGLLVADTTFRPSHKAWISAVKWSPDDPYHLASTSHDGTVKLWDIRSPLPLHTIRAFAVGEKGLSLCYSGKGNGGFILAGGTDCTVKQFRCGAPPAVEK